MLLAILPIAFVPQRVLKRLWARDLVGFSELRRANKKCHQEHDSLPPWVQDSLEESIYLLGRDTQEEWEHEEVLTNL